MTRSRPLRFLLVVGAGWTTLRTIWLGPPWWTGPAAATGTTAAEETVALPAPPLPSAGAARSGRGAAAVSAGRSRAAAAPVARPGVPPVAPPRLARAATGQPERRKAAVAAQSPPAPPARPSAAPHRPDAGRWSVHGWALLRPAGAAGLAPGGTLGGAQAGMRATYRLNRDPERPLALAVRLSSPLRDRDGTEAALGLDWRPTRRLPLHILAERRQKLGREGRSAFALAVHGGVSAMPVGPLRLDGYAQAGIVGARSRQRFADGALRLSMPVGGGVGLGAGAWAAAQPGVARIDLGPQASLRLPVAGGSVFLAADWRLRVAGNAGPDSGPALTLATDF